MRQVIPGYAPSFSVDCVLWPESTGWQWRQNRSPWTPPSVSEPLRLIGDPTPNLRGDPALSEATQSLWIDGKSLLPLRWEVSDHGLRRYGFDFTYSSTDLRLPSQIHPPDCIR
jgi:hypothetical protein